MDECVLLFILPRMSFPPRFSSRKLRYVRTLKCFLNKPERNISSQQSFLLMRRMMVFFGGRCHFKPCTWCESHSTDSSPTPPPTLLKPFNPKYFPFSSKFLTFTLTLKAPLSTDLNKILTQCIHRDPSTRIEMKV